MSIEASSQTMLHQEQEPWNPSTVDADATALVQKEATTPELAPMDLEAEYHTPELITEEIMPDRLAPSKFRENKVSVAATLPVADAMPIAMASTAVNVTPPATALPTADTALSPRPRPPQTRRSLP